eukprot:TRINITY_DN54270_c0_g1_i1.p2 TRINITY_DN54270_c0_g1~~TRINITY_DN54270_c0_g1_i1.p2  ORF type:complete len:152 (+),score=47.72 TRINITY_DN54270_c0_g1_i1:32-487(+)
MCNVSLICEEQLLQGELVFIDFFFFSSRRRHTRCREVSWARRCVQETGVHGILQIKMKPERYTKVGLIGTGSYANAYLVKGENSGKQFVIKEIDITSMSEAEKMESLKEAKICLLYTSDAADDTPCVDLGGRRIIKKKKSKIQNRIRRKRQ